jgi:hypothetical protein
MILTQHPLPHTFIYVQQFRSPGVPHILYPGEDWIGPTHLQQWFIGDIEIVPAGLSVCKIVIALHNFQPIMQRVVTIDPIISIGGMVNSDVQQVM